MATIRFNFLNWVCCMRDVTRKFFDFFTSQAAGEIMPSPPPPLSPDLYVCNDHKTHLLSSRLLRYARTEYPVDDIECIWSEFFDVLAEVFAWSVHNLYVCYDCFFDLILFLFISYQFRVADVILCRIWCFVLFAISRSFDSTLWFVGAREKIDKKMCLDLLFPAKMI